MSALPSRVFTRPSRRLKDTIINQRRRCAAILLRLRHVSSAPPLGTIFKGPTYKAQCVRSLLQVVTRHLLPCLTVPPSLCLVQIIIHILRQLGRSLDAHWTPIGHPLDTHWTRVQWVSNVCPMGVQCMSNVHPMYVQCGMNDK